METESDETGEVYEGEIVFDEALYHGYVEQVEMYINEFGSHDYRRVKKLSKEELEGAYYNDDYSEMTIQGVKYYVMLQSKELDEEAELDLNELMQLDEKYRLPIVLHDIEGYSAREIGKILGLTETNVRNRIFRGKKILRKQLKGVL